MKILVAIQHQLTKPQIDELNPDSNEIILFKENNPNLFAKMANVSINYNADDIELLADQFIRYIREQKFDIVIGPIGSPDLMFAVAFNCGYRLAQQTTTPFFRFAVTERKSVEETQPDGSVIKRSVFEHIKFR